MRLVCQGTFWVASRESSTVSNFKREHGISLETLHQEGVSSHYDGGNSWFFSSCGGILELRELREPVVLPQGNPISIRVVRGSWGLLSSHCRANRSHVQLCPETPCSSPVASWILGLHSRFTWGVRPRSSGNKELCSPLEL